MSADRRDADSIFDHVRNEVGGAVLALGDGVDAVTALRQLFVARDQVVPRREASAFVI